MQNEVWIRLVAIGHELRLKNYRAVRVRCRRSARIFLPASPAHSNLYFEGCEQIAATTRQTVDQPGRIGLQQREALDFSYGKSLMIYLIRRHLCSPEISLIMHTTYCLSGHLTP